MKDFFYFSIFVQFYDTGYLGTLVKLNFKNNKMNKICVFVTVHLSHSVTLTGHFMFLKQINAVFIILSIKHKF